MMLMLKRMWIQLTTDKRRFGLFCAALGIGLLLWARLIVVANIPKHAIAEPSPGTAAEAPTNNDRRPALGIRLDDTGLILQGAIPAALLALGVQGGFDLADRFLVPRGLRIKRES